MTKFEECALQFVDALDEAKKWFAAGEFEEAIAELRRAQREAEGAALAKGGVE